MLFISKYVPDHRVSTRGLLRLNLQASRSRFSDLGETQFPNSGSMIFIVGCGHSGTTLLAARFGNLPNVYVVPSETEAFLPQTPLIDTRQKFASYFHSAHLLGKSIVVEKTPKHVHCVRRIQRIAPQARFVVMIRNALDVCASLKSRLGDLDFAIARYITDNRQAERLKGVRNVFFLKYEDFVSNPQASGRQLLHDLGIDWNLSFVEGTTSTYEGAQFNETNMLKRQHQVAQVIEPRIDSWKNALTAAEAELVRTRTERLSTRLGYGPEYRRGATNRKPFPAVH